MLDYVWDSYCFKIGSILNDYLHFQIHVYRMISTKIDKFYSFHNCLIKFISFLTIILLIFYYVLQIILVLPQSMFQPVKLSNIIFDIYIGICKFTITLHKIKFKTNIFWEKLNFILPTKFDILIFVDICFKGNGVQCEFKSLKLSFEFISNDKNYFYHQYYSVINSIKKAYMYVNINDINQQPISYNGSLILFSKIIIHLDKLIVKLTPISISASIYVFFKHFIIDFNDRNINNSLNIINVPKDKIVSILNYKLYDMCGNYIKQVVSKLFQMIVSINIHCIKLDIDQIQLRYVENCCIYSMILYKFIFLFNHELINNVVHQDSKNIVRKSYDKLTYHSKKIFQDIIPTLCSSSFMNMNIHYEVL